MEHIRFCFLLSLVLRCFKPKLLIPGWQVIIVKLVIIQLVIQLVIEQLFKVQIRMLIGIKLLVLIEQLMLVAIKLVVKHIKWVITT